jgi:hypothetical protein
VGNLLLATEREQTSLRSVAHGEAYGRAINHEFSIDHQLKLNLFIA